MQRYGEFIRRFCASVLNENHSYSTVNRSAGILFRIFGLMLVSVQASELQSCSITKQTFSKPVKNTEI